jgi:hypothetical protein
VLQSKMRWVHPLKGPPLLDRTAMDSWPLKVRVVGMRVRACGNSNHPVLFRQCALFEQLVPPASVCHPACCPGTSCAMTLCRHDKHCNIQQLVTHRPAAAFVKNAYNHTRFVHISTATHQSCQPPACRGKGAQAAFRRLIEHGRNEVVI